MSNPYRGLPDHQFWRRSVSNVEPHAFDPVVAPRFQVGPSDRVATGGSCFAQHIARKLGSIGFNYFVAEAVDDLKPTERNRRNYGVFSARYGNIYTTAQLWQLFQEAFGERQPADVVWHRDDGRFVDPFRPQIEPDGFETADAVRAARTEHLEAVQRMFRDCEIFVFTLGLTEAWRSRRDGSVVPLAPGVGGASSDEAGYEFVNFTVDEVVDDLRRFLLALKGVNPGVRVVLTVSPVPLIATFENRHVMCSTTYSKSVLRVAAQTIVGEISWVDYFPSYEIITGSNAGGRYFGPDHRDVNHLGVAHAMRCFVRNYTPGIGTDTRAIELMMEAELVGTNGVVCDEEMIAAVR